MTWKPDWTQPRQVGFGWVVQLREVCQMLRVYAMQEERTPKPYIIVADVISSAITKKMHRLMLSQQVLCDHSIATQADMHLCYL